MLLKPPDVEDRSSDGYTVRRASRRDAERLRGMLSRCSVGTIYERFHSPYSTVPRWMADLMVGVDHGESFVALAGGAIVGHVMYVWLNDREAEVAVVVEDAWQSRGVGRRLLSAAADAARLRGVEAFLCETLTENRRVAVLAQAVFAGAEREVDGALCRIRAPLNPSR